MLRRRKLLAATFDISAIRIRAVNARNAETDTNANVMMDVMFALQIDNPNKAYSAAHLALGQIHAKSR